MKILRAGDYRRMPWKNGKGETVEIAVFPHDATVNDFDWRISMAAVVEDGPFSLFEDVDRTLSVLSGEGIVLSVEGQADVILRQKTLPHAFPADVPTQSRLLADAITDLNVMTRRGRYIHDVAAIEVADGKLGPVEGAHVTLILCHDGMRLASGGQLGPLDALLFDAGDEALDIAEGMTSRIYRIVLSRLV